MPSGYRQNVRHTQDGEEVKGAVASRAAKDLEQNTNNLRDRIDAAEIGESLFMRGATLEPDASIGMPVYWNDESQQWERALAAVESDPDSGTLVASATAFVGGIVFCKENSTNGDILLMGKADFSATFDLTATVDGAVEAGQYYLSSQEAGKLVQQRPAVSVFVLSVCEGFCIVRPDVKDFVEDHIHYSFELTARPAGEHTPPALGDTHEILNADSSLPGWLPADDPIFKGTAPANAKFGYNLAAQTSLDKVWPPIPVEAAMMEMLHLSVFSDVKSLHHDAVLDFPSISANSFEELTVACPGASIDDTATASVQGGPTGDGIIQAWVSATDVVTVRYTNPTGGAIDPPSATYHITILKDATGPDAVATSFAGYERVPTEFLTINKYGIWWLTSCYNEVPWPADLDTTITSSSSSLPISSSSMSSSMSSEAMVESCPVDKSMRLRLNYVRMVYATDKSTVTSLQPAEGSPIRYVNCEGEFANTGDLFASLDFALLVDREEDIVDSRVFKDLTADGIFKTGYVVEGIKAASSNVTVSGTVNRGTNGQAGIVTIDLATDPEEREVNPEIVRLSDVKQRNESDIPHLAFLNGRVSSIRLRYNVGVVGVPDTPKAKLRLLLFGQVTGTLAPLTASYRLLPRPTGGGSIPIPTTDTALTITTAVSVTADEYIEIESEEFTIAPGDTVFVTLSRDGVSDTYAGELGLIRRNLIVVPS